MTSETTNRLQHFDAIVVGGGPSGATVANDLACKGIKVMLTWNYRTIIILYKCCRVSLIGKGSSSWVF